MGRLSLRVVTCIIAAVLVATTAITGSLLKPADAITFPPEPSMFKFANDGSYAGLKIGSKCSAAGGCDDERFTRMSGLAIDSLGNYYLTDLDRIKKFDSSGNFVTSWTMPPISGTTLSSLWAVSVDSSDNVYVADNACSSTPCSRGINRIIKFSPDGALLEIFGETCRSIGGCSNERLSKPTGLAIDSTDHVYVMDGNRIKKFDSNGGFIVSWTLPRVSSDSLSLARGIAIDSSDSIYVADDACMGAHCWINADRILKFSSDGGLIQSFRISGAFTPALNPLLLPYAPVGISVDSAGNLYVAEDGHVMKYTNDGSSSDVWEDNCVCTFNSIPSPVLADSSDNLYVIANITFPDTDRDSIPDDVELFGDLAAFSADPCRKTIAVEVDYMTVSGPNSHSHQPNPLAISTITAAFNEAPVPARIPCPYSGFPVSSTGVQLIVDIDDAIPEIATIDFNPVCIRELLYCPSWGFEVIKAANFDDDRRPYWHYSLWAHSIASGRTGKAEVYGNDFVVSLGSGTTGVGSVNAQAGTFMHELGHNLGLEHGGGDSSNCKPNYISVMSYTFQTPGIQSPRGASAQTLTSGSGAAVRYDYSSQPLPTLYELSLDENSGIADGADTTRWSSDNGASWKTALGSSPIDWDYDTIGNGPFEDSVSVNVNRTPTGGCQGNDHDRDLETFGPLGHLAGHNDWANLDYNFRDNISYQDGAVDEEFPEEMTIEQARWWEQTWEISLAPDSVTGTVTGDGAKGEWSFRGTVHELSDGHGEGSFTITRDVSPLMPTICEYSEFRDVAINENSATFRALGVCTGENESGGFRFNAENGFTIIDQGTPLLQGRGVDHIDVNYLGSGGISISGGTMDSGDFMVTG